MAEGSLREGMGAEVVAGTGERLRAVGPHAGIVEHRHGVAIGGVALEAARAGTAGAEGDGDAVAGRDLSDRGADLLDDPGAFMAEDGGGAMVWLALKTRSVWQRPTPTTRTRISSSRGSSISSSSMLKSASGARATAAVTFIVRLTDPVFTRALFNGAFKNLNLHLN